MPATASLLSLPVAARSRISAAAAGLVVWDGTGSGATLFALPVRGNRRYTLNPVAEIMPNQCTPEYERVIAKIRPPAYQGRAFEVMLAQASNDDGEQVVFSRMPPTPRRSVKPLPGMRFVPVKSAEQQAHGMVLKVRETLVGQRTQLVNTLRGDAAEFGVVAGRGIELHCPIT